MAEISACPTSGLGIRGSLIFLRIEQRFGRALCFLFLGGLAALFFILFPILAQAQPQDAYIQQSSNSVEPLGKPLVVIDPGHGGEKRGTVSDSGIPEKSLTLAIAKKLSLILEKMQVRTLLTRTDDVHVDLKERIQQANHASAEVFVSIHLNAMPSKRSRRITKGVETYFLAKMATGEHAENVATAENIEGGEGDLPQDDLAYILADLAESEAHQDASKLAHTVHGALTTRLPTRNRGVHQAPFMVLKGALMPAILVEVGYLSHPKESALLIDGSYQETITHSLAWGIVSFLVQKQRLSRSVFDGLATNKFSKNNSRTGDAQKRNAGGKSAPPKGEKKKIQTP